MLNLQLEDTKSAKVDMLQWSSRVALDIIGLAGFNYDLDTLQQGVDGSKLATALHRLSSPKSFPIIVFLKIFIPPLRLIQFDHQSRETQRTRSILRQIGSRIIEEKQKELEYEKLGGSTYMGSETSGESLFSNVHGGQPNSSQ